MDMSRNSRSTSMQQHHPTTFLSSITLGMGINSSTPIPIPVPHASFSEAQPSQPVSVPKVDHSKQNVNHPEDIIHSPLDERRYRAVTLPNGLRAMLISTYDVESYPDEMDATRTPCQVPEVAEFNKTYLGYDNPAARVKCNCPCDHRKPCCGAPFGEMDEDKQKAFDSIRLTCCNRNAPPKEKKKKKGKSHGHVLKSKAPVESESYKAELFRELEEREQSIQNRRKSRHLGLSEMPGKYTQVKRDNALVKKTKSFVDSKQFRESSKIDKKKDEIDQNFTKSERNLVEVPSEEVLDKMRKSKPKHYPNPPSHSQGLHSPRNFPTGTGSSSSSRPRTHRPHFSSEFNFDLEGTVYLVVGSGYFDDPVDQPGLAHFCEHAVFLGSNKFPEPNQLFKLVLPYDGYVNAYTSGMTTTFTVSASYRLFPLAVEILGDMVGFPLFPNALVTSEIEALDSEYSLRQDDTPKYFQLIGSLAKKGHVMRKMDSGNFNTLTVPNFYRKLVEWRKLYYNPRRMTVALEAPFPLDFLEHLVRESFGKIAEGAPIPMISSRHLLLSCPFEMSRFHQIFHVPSVYHSEFMALHWALDAKAWKNLQVKPLEYLGAIISHRAQGGLFDYLTSQGLATNVDAGCWESDVTRNHYTTVFSISIDMTDKGFKRQDNILQAIFGYIAMLIKNGPQKSFFQELQKQQLEAFHYRAAESTLSIAESVSRWMQFIPPKWCLISPSLTCKFDEELIQKYTHSLRIETANVIIFSKNYRGVEYSTRSSMEEFYNTPYASFNFPEELEQKLCRTKEEYAAKFSLPPPNPFLLDTACNRARDKDLCRKGNLLKIKGKITASYLGRKVRLVRGLLPQARFSLWIGSPAASYVGAPEGSSTKILIWSLYFNELFESKFYHISNADIQLETEIAQGEIHVVLAGPHTILPTIMEQVVDLFKNFENVIDPVSFEVVKSCFIESLDNTILDNRFLAWDLFYFLWTNNHDLIFDHKRNAEKLTYANFVDFIKAFKKKMYIQVHLYGYVTKNQAENVIKAVQTIDYEPVDLRQYLTLHCLRLPLGERVIKVQSQNPSIHTSVVINCYQFGMLTIEEEEAVNFFAKTMSDAAFYKLRTEQQLGYIIIIYAECTFGVSSIVVELVTQPKNFSTDYCNHCIDQFLMEFFIDNLGTADAFTEFGLGKPRVDLPFPAVQQLFASFLLPNPLTYRKLSIQVVGTLQDGPNPSAKNAEMSSDVNSSFTSPNKVAEAEGVENIVLSKVQSLGSSAKAISEHVRQAKRSFQMRSANNSKKRGSGASAKDNNTTPASGNANTTGKNSGVVSRVVKDVTKFKNSLMQLNDLKAINDVRQ